MSLVSVDDAGSVAATAAYALTGAWRIHGLVGEHPRYGPGFCKIQSEDVQSPWFLLGVVTHIEPPGPPVLLACGINGDCKIVQGQHLVVVEDKPELNEAQKKNLSEIAGIHLLGAIDVWEPTAEVTPNAALVHEKQSNFIEVHFSSPLLFSIIVIHNKK